MKDSSSTGHVAEITSSMRGLAAEVPIEHTGHGLDRASAIHCDGLHTVAQTSLTNFVGTASQETLHRVGAAVSYALDC